MDEDHGRDKLSELASAWGDGFAWEVIGALGQGVTIVDADFRFVYANPTFAQMVGRSPAELIGLTPFVVTHPEDHDLLRQARQRRLSSEESTYEARLMRPDGSVTYAQITGVPQSQGDQIVGTFTVITDLTAHRQAQEKLRQSEERYRRVVEDQTDFIVRWLPDGTRLFANEAYCQHFGQTKEEMIGSNFFPLIHEEDRAAIRAKIASLTSANPIAEDEHRSLLPDGSIRWHRWVDRAFFDENGRITELQSVGRDITEQKMAESALRQLTRRLELTLDNLTVVAYEVDKEGTFLLSRGKGLEKLGLQPDEVVGLSIFDVYADFPLIIDVMRQALSGEAKRFEIEVAGVIWDATFIPILSEEGKVERLFGTAIDVTQWRRAENALRHSEARYRSLVESSGAGIWQITPEGDNIYINPAMCALLGVEGPEAMTGKTYQDFFTPESVATIKSHHARRLKGEASSYEAEIIRADGQRRHVIVYGAPIMEADNQTYSLIGTFIDITDRKQAEQTLETQQKFIQKIFDTDPNVLYVYDFDEQRPVFQNRHVAAAIGYSAAEIQAMEGDVLSLMAHPEDLPRILAHFDRLRNADDGDILSIEFRMRHANGSWRWFDGRDTVFKRGKDGRVQQFIGTATDITWRKEAEEAIRLSEARYRSVVEDMPGLLCRFQPGGILEFVNEAYARTFNLKPEEMLGQSFLSFIPEEYRKSVQADLDALTPEFPVSTIEHQAVVAGGEVRWQRWTNRLLTDERGQFIAFQAFGLDITEQKEAEEALRQSETELQHIIDTVPEGVLLLGADGSIYLTNPVADKYLATLAPERENGRLTRLGNRPLPELFTSPPKGLWHEITKGGFVFEAIARPVENNLHDGNWVLVLRDVTQERDFQRQVQQQERLAAVGQLASGIAHDFNNILAVITLYAQLISRTVKLPAQAQERLYTIEQQSEQASGLIQQVLDFSRQSVLERRPLDLLPFMENLVALLNRTLPEHIRIDINSDAEAYFIQADSSRIQQVIMNLAVNARDAMPEGGRLQIRLAHVQTEVLVPMPIQDMPPGNWIQIAVSDSGSGIGPEALTHIFEPFYTTKEVGQGTGLGLAQVYGIVQQHEGYIDVVTELGQGTTFSLYFPTLDIGENVSDPVDRASLRFGKGQKILLVEDDPATREALQDSLALLNYEIITATNGREALTLLTLKADVVDLVVSDVVMPEMGGIALFHAMKEQKLSIPVVLLTGHPLSNEMENLQKLGLAGWLPKPPDLGSLSYLLAEVLAVSSHP